MNAGRKKHKSQVIEPYPIGCRFVKTTKDDGALKGRIGDQETPQRAEEHLAGRAQLVRIELPGFGSTFRSEKYLKA
jgi:hypothetical protein